MMPVLIYTLLNKAGSYEYATRDDLITYIYSKCLEIYINEEYVEAELKATQNLEDTFDQQFELDAAIDRTLALDDFKTAFAAISLRNAFENGAVGGIDCNDVVKKAFMATLLHTTRPGKGAYAGVSVWKKKEGEDKIKIYALAEHGGDNKSYKRVAGDHTKIPSKWRLP